MIMNQIMNQTDDESINGSSSDIEEDEIGL